MSPIRAALKVGGRTLCVGASIVAILLVLAGNSLAVAAWFIALSLLGLGIWLMA